MQVPDSITSWVGEAVGLSEAWGLGVAAPALLKTFKPFFVDFTLPLHVVRGEQAKIPLSVYNYMGTCAEVLNPPFPPQPSLCLGVWVGDWGTHEVRRPGSGGSASAAWKGTEHLCNWGGARGRGGSCVFGEAAPSRASHCLDPVCLRVAFPHVSSLHEHLVCGSSSKDPSPVGVGRA